jgi:hypothetical protein
LQDPKVPAPILLEGLWSRGPRAKSGRRNPGLDAGREIPARRAAEHSKGAKGDPRNSRLKSLDPLPQSPFVPLLCSAPRVLLKTTCSDTRNDVRLRRPSAGRDLLVARYPGFRHPCGVPSPGATAQRPLRGPWTLAKVYKHEDPDGPRKARQGTRASLSRARKVAGGWSKSAIEVLLTVWLPAGKVLTGAPKGRNQAAFGSGRGPRRGL